MAITGGQRAYAMAQSGVMRAGSSRSNVHSPLVFVAINGVHYGTGRAVTAQRVVNETLSISEREGETPNTASFQVRGFQPTDGQDVVMTMGSKNNLDRLFAGTILRDTHGYSGTSANGKDAVNVIDYTWQLTRETITARFTNDSGTVIARAIIALAAHRGFTAVAVADDLPIVDEITFTDQPLASALTQLCKRIGAYWKSTYHKDIQLGITTGSSQTDPTTLTEASAQLTEVVDFTVTRDLGQVITRQPVEGGGGTALAACAVGETILPVSEPGWYSASGGMVACGPQRITYAGKTEAAPTAAPTAVVAPGLGLGVGVYQYAASYVTAAGESLPSPRVTVDAGLTIADPTTAPTVTDPLSAGGLTPGALYRYKYSFHIGANPTTAGQETLGSSPSIALVTTNGRLDCWCPGHPNTLVKWVKVWRTLANGSTYYQLAGFAFGNTGNSQGVADSVTDALLSTFPTEPTTNDAIFRQVSLSGITPGPAGTTARKVWRTVVGGSQLKLQSTIANNTTTTLTDAATDGSLGANAPTSDTSGLSINAITTTSGATAARAVSMTVVTAGGFSASGGWALLGTVQIRYAAKTGTALTGIPASGPGSIPTTIPSGSKVEAAPALLGIPASGAGSILYAIQFGDPVNLRVVIEDVPAQSALGAEMGGGDDGVIVGNLIQDGRISETEARARGLAQIELRKQIVVSVSYASHDKNTHAGRTISVNLPAPTSTVGSFKLQAVTISNFHPARWPTYRAEASSSRFTLEDLLRIARKAT